MSNKRILILISSAALGILTVYGLTFATWTPMTAYLTYLLLAFFFLGVLVSSQQYEEDSFSKIERVVSAFLFSYIMFFRLLYAPLNQFFFGILIKDISFASDVLRLFLFLIFFFLFGTAFLIFNSYARFGFLSRCIIFNNPKSFLVLRIFLVSAVGIFLMLYIRNSFFSIKHSALMNKILPPQTCNWAYAKYPNFLNLGFAAKGRSVCLFSYAQDQYDMKYCDYIKEGAMREMCVNYFIPESERER